MKSHSITATSQAPLLAPVGPAFPRQVAPRTGFQRLPSPGQVTTAMPLGPRAADVDRARDEVRNVLDGRDDRLIIITGPCSIHDPRAALDYARWLADQSRQLHRDLLLVMRAYVEKPRTTTGWRGLVADPHMNGRCDMATGILTARALLLELAELRVPAATECVEPSVAPYLADTVTWTAIGARTVESQPHRQLASGMPMPVGLKNGTGGSVKAAVDACLAAAQPHSFVGSAPDGRLAIVTTAGNKDTCVVLRGGTSGPNYEEEHVTAATAMIERAGLPPRLIIDASHGNSGKDASRQASVTECIATQVAAGSTTIVGVMLESNLRAGRQEPGDLTTLTYGRSVTDDCIDTATTATILQGLAASVRARRTTREQAW